MLDSTPSGAHARSSVSSDWNSLNLLCTVRYCPDEYEEVDDDEEDDEVDEDDEDDEGEVVVAIDAGDDDKFDDAAASLLAPCPVVLAAGARS